MIIIIIIIIIFITKTAKNKRETAMIDISRVIYIALC